VRAVLVDTGAWIGLLSKNDQYAAQAAAHYSELTSAGARLVTTNYVVDETATRLRYGAGLRAALGFRAMLDEAIASRRVTVAWVDESLEREGWKLLGQYADVKLSLTDATSAAVARKRKISEVFGFDSDFEALGFLVLPLR
jgi:predicted nucleic acid-binding protein